MPLASATQLQLKWGLKEFNTIVTHLWLADTAFRKQNRTIILQMHFFFPEESAEEQGFLEFTFDSGLVSQHLFWKRSAQKWCSFSWNSQTRFCFSLHGSFVINFPIQSLVWDLHCIQRRATKLTKNLEHKSCDKQLMEQKCLSLSKNNRTRWNGL